MVVCTPDPSFHNNSLVIEKKKRRTSIYERTEEQKERRREAERRRSSGQVPKRAPRAKSPPHDWEESRLDIEGFVTDIFVHRTSKAGLIWYEAPINPYGDQPEYSCMRWMCEQFENKNKLELGNIADELLSMSQLTYSTFCQVINLVGNPHSEGDNSMTYGRLIGVITSAALIASRMLEDEELAPQVSNLALYTSLFLKLRINKTWKATGRSWADFVECTERMQLVAAQESQDHPVTRRQKRLSLGVGVGVAMLAVGALVGGRALLK